MNKTVLAGGGVAMVVVRGQAGLQGLREIRARLAGKGNGTSPRKGGALLSALRRAGSVFAPLPCLETPQCRARSQHSRRDRRL